MQLQELLSCSCDEKVILKEDGGQDGLYFVVKLSKLESTKQPKERLSSVSTATYDWLTPHAGLGVLSFPSGCACRRKFKNSPQVRSIRARK